MAAENGMPDNEDVKKKALLRLAVAGVVTALALGGLWWIDQGADKAKETASPPPSPAPIVPAQPAEAAPPTSLPAEEGSTEPAPPPEPAISEEPALIPDLPPPPRVNNGSPRPVPSAGPASPRTAAGPGAGTTSPPPLTTPAATPAAKPAPAPAAKLPVPPVPAGQGFVVQLGVFSNPDNAREMVEKLTRQGIRANLEARVQLGPFLNRQEAEKAQAEMRKLGYPGLVTTAYPVK